MDVPTRRDISRTVRIEVKPLLSADRKSLFICRVDWHNNG